MKQLSFSGEYHYPEHPDGITIPVLLSSGDLTIRVAAKVDTGAAACLFRHEEGVKLKLTIEQGMPTVFSSLAGSIEAFGHEVTMQTVQLRIQVMVYFAKYPGLPRNILGRQGWLRNLRLAVIDYDNLLYLNAYDS